ncbi:MAG TPA: Clp protease N-terminal domain-containing protein [Phycisphaerae bacterium]|nr:Clp protease N-terminal domain-containing protein [Phycisphaerae bacterium]
MYEKLTPRMEQVIKLSQQIARDYEQDYVGTEHLLLAILREGTGLGVAVLRELRIDEAKAKEHIDRFIKNSLEDTWVFGRLPGTPHFRNVMAVAIEEARQLESKQIDSEHLLIALAREDGSVAQATLNELGAKAGTLRARLREHMDRTPANPPKPEM